jgi:hypothetical protein
MKKAILTIGLFSLVMVLTSFTTPESTNAIKLENKANGSVSIREDKKMDTTYEVFKIENIKLDIVGGGSTGQNDGGNVKQD